MWPDINQLVARRPAPHRQFAPVVAPPAPDRHIYSGEPETCRRNLRRFLPILAHLGLMLAVFKVYRVEGRAFQLLVGLALAALPIHYLLPYRRKKPFFIAVSLVGLVWVFGPAVAACVIPAAVGLIALCRLPVTWRARAVALTATVAVLAITRATVASVLPEGTWAVLATMMMFRTILYMYELKHAREPESLVDALSYFFLLPNYCFLHFPVVDYRTFRRGYFATDIHTIQQSGLKMMFRGTVHLLLYRLVYHELLIPVDEVHNLASLVGYIVCNYLLYLRVSGQFHVACGMLHLFGFQLPETHHHYLLATSFTDYWRRINIYWKDFMVRVFFNPTVFRLKRWPQPHALAAATVTVFVVTWALHAYQSFWLRGTWGFSVPDALFWGILGALVLVNVQLDAKASRARKVKGNALTPRQQAIRVAKTLATFTTISLLWSLWSSPSVGAWLEMMSQGLREPASLLGAARDSVTFLGDLVLGLSGYSRAS